MGNPWAMAAFTAFVCLAAGMMLAVAAAEILEFPERVTAGGAAAALLALAVGGGCFIANIGRPELLLGLLGNPKAAIFPEIVAFCAAVICALVYILFLLRGCRTGTAAAISLVGGVVALALLAAVGKTFFLAWRPAWNTFTIMLPFAAWGLVLGAVGFSALSAAAGFRIAGTGKAVLATGAVAAAAVASYIAALLLSSNKLAGEAAMKALSGDLSPVFWGVVVGVGFAVPAAVILLFGKRGKPLFVSAALAVCAVSACAAFQLLTQQLGIPTWHFFVR